MPKINPRLKSLDDLFADEEVQPYVPTQLEGMSEKVVRPNEHGVQYIPPKDIRTFSGHPFRLYDGERLNDLVASVNANGILIPVIVRKIPMDENGYEYEMLAGHNRQHAAFILGLDTIPCIVKEHLSDEEAWIYVIETNVIQRSFTDMLPSEKAAVLAMRYSKMFSQGKRNDILEELKRLENPDYIKENDTCGHDVHKSNSREKIGAEYGLEGRTVARYVRVDSLIPALKIRLDNGEITLVVSVELSYLSADEQQMIETVLSENEFKTDIKKAGLLRSYAGRLSVNTVYSILSGEKARKPKSVNSPSLKIKSAVYAKYFQPDTKPAEIERVIGEALALYFSQTEGVPSEP